MKIICPYNNDKCIGCDDEDFVPCHDCPISEEIISDKESLKEEVEGRESF